MATLQSTTSPPHPSSTLVNISEDADARLIRALAPSAPDPAAFEKSCTAAISAGDAAILLRTVMDSGALAGLLKHGAYTADEAVGAFSLLTVYLDRVGDVAAARKLCGQLAAAVVRAGAPDDGGDADAGTRERQAAMVAALFNLRSDGGEKVRLLATVVALADAAALSPGEPRGVATLADMLDAAELKASLVLWEGGRGGVDNLELRALYRAVSKGMDRVLAKLTKVEDDKTVTMKIEAAMERKQTYMLLFLETYKEGSPLDAEATSVAREAAIYAIRDPINLFATQRRILAIPAVAALAKSHAALYDLLKIFMEGKLQDYRDFAAMPDKSTAFAACGLDEAACQRNMCLLSLVSLAGEHEEIPYGAVASTLDVPEAEVER